MAKGENIFKRKDGRWEARYVKDYDLSGKIKYGFCYGRTYKEAKEKAERCRAALVVGAPEPQCSSRNRFFYYCDEWLSVCSGKLKMSTCERYETILENHIKPKLGGYFPWELTNALVETFKNDLLSEGLSPARVRDVLIVFRTVIKHSSRQFPNVFPEIEVVYPKENKKEERVLSKEEQEHFISYLLEDIDPCKFGILLTMNTGIRIGELCALKWEKVSLRERTIRITATMQRLRNAADDGGRTKIVIGTPKSDTSVRTIPLTDSITELCKKMYTQNPSAYILTGTADYMEPRTLQYRLEKYTSECGLEGVHFHTLRHTFATRCVEVGFEVKSLSEILGHATTKITLDKYVHSSLEMKRGNMEKLSAAGM